MIDEFEHSGFFWFRDQPEKHFPGLLKFTPDEGATLNLMGDIKKLNDIFKFLEPEIILGITTNNLPITLYKSYERGTTNLLSDLQTMSLYVNCVFLGAHFHHESDIKFKDISIHYSYLDDWANISGFDIKPTYQDNEFFIKYKRPNEINVNISDEWKLSIQFQATYPTLNLVQKEACITQKTFIKFEPRFEKSFEDYKKIIWYFQNFLSLAVMEPVFNVIIGGTTEINKEDMFGKEYYPPVKIYYKQPYLKKNIATVHPLEMLFRFIDIKDKFQYFLTNWFNKGELLEPCYELYFATLYSHQIYAQHKFLSLIQAVESYHRRIFNSFDFSEKEKKSIFNYIDKCIPKIYKDKLLKKIKYIDEPSLNI